MITPIEIYRADQQRLDEIYNQLIVEKMKLDKFFSVFLDATEFDEEDTTTPEWVTYKEMLKDYERVNHLINTTKYHLKKHV